MELAATGGDRDQSAARHETHRRCPRAQRGISRAARTAVANVDPFPDVARGRRVGDGRARDRVRARKRSKGTEAIKLIRAYRLQLSSLAVLALVFGFAGPVAAGNQVPIRGTLEGTETVTQFVFPLESVDLKGTGKATQLGRFTLDGQAHVNLLEGTGSGSFVFTAANGDTLTAEFIGRATVIGPGVIALSERAVIIGGTGRFAGASGSFIVERTLYAASGTTVGSFEGTVSSPAQG